MFLLHAHGAEAGWAESILLDGLIDTLKIIPFLFLTYLLMEFIEHRAGEKAESFMKRAGGFAPVVGGALGIVPQCGFSAAAANLYAGRVISVGTLIAVFLSTSDEMIPVLLTGNVGADKILIIVLYKCIVGILLGFLIDGAVRLFGIPRSDIGIDNFCEEDNCRCERGILLSALHHTLTTGLFILITTFAINALMFFVGDENISHIMVNIPVVSHFICSVVGLIPNCAASVALTRFAISGFISSGAMMSGLFTGAGVGLLVLFKVNKNIKENLLVLFLMVIFGVVFGCIADLLPFLAL